MRLTRRDFVKGVGAGVLSLGGAPPAFLLKAAESGKAANDGRVLVLVELAGGNDGLNTVIPFADPEYAKNRPGIGIPKNDVIKINDSLGFHPRMKGLKQLYDDGVLAVIQGVGYPNPDRSHFRSMDIWHTAQPDSKKIADGWIGRMLDARAKDAAGELPALSLGCDKQPVAFMAGKINIPNIKNIDSYRLRLNGSDDDMARRRELMARLANINSPDGDASHSAANAELDFLRRTARTAFLSAERLRQVSEGYKPTAPYPESELGQRLQRIAQMIASDFGPRIFFVSLDGFDTHSQQVGAHAALLTELSDAIRAFAVDLKGHKIDDRVVLATFSEFGRRVKENGSLGTDHGAASQMFILTPTGKAGIHGAHPSLTDLDLREGDLKQHTDFRRVYATLLDKWLGYPSEPILGGNFDPLNFI